MTDPTDDYVASVNAVLRVAAADGGELYPCRLGVFCDDCEDTFEGDFIVSTQMTSAERLSVVRDHAVKTMDWRCDEHGDYCERCKAYHPEGQE